MMLVLDLRKYKWLCFEVGDTLIRVKQGDNGSRHIVIDAPKSVAVYYAKAEPEKVETE